MFTVFPNHKSLIVALIISVEETLKWTKKIHIFCCVADTWYKRWWWYFENICCHALWNVDLLMCLVGYSWLVITRILLCRHMWQWSFCKCIQQNFSALCYVSTMETPHCSVVHIMHVCWSLLDVMVFGVSFYQLYSLSMVTNHWGWNLNACNL